MVFSDIAQKALNGFSSSSSNTTATCTAAAAANDPAILAPDGLTLETVLLDQAPPPFSLKDFSEYLKLTYCNENLLFYEAVIEYKERCSAYFDVHLDENAWHSCKPAPVILSDNRVFDFSAYTKHVLTPREQLWFDTLIYKFEVILKDFILSDAPQEINIPYEVRHQLLQSYQTQQLYHPALLFPACSAVIELLRISAFISFANDPKRLYCPMKKKSFIKRQKSSPVISTTSTSTDAYPAPIPALPPMPLTPPPPTDITSSTSVGFLKRITATFKIRYSSSSSSQNEAVVDNQITPPSPQSPKQPQSNWRQINTSPSAFSSSATMPPAPSSSSPPISLPMAVTPPSIIKSSTSTSSSINSSSTTSSSVDSLQHGTFLKHLTSTHAGYSSNNRKPLLPSGTAAAIATSHHAGH
ncbi:hypothetical protein V8B55DRAFT_1537784 [Mucor lusitanicus]|uniref:RGS domain-containing protein n=2 Tax=Mucor circinelloides f. lusitanicus TaxID=29924 RepID=A0A168N4D8_MUCCL|nr:hypothetical protein FB192DRAFT_1386361 [Mucor lusitanicus]OAD05764.1 hypothetical protein MUCCIDRAFT_106321 [Mucor lusitanicus CBS 277.49]